MKKTALCLALLLVLSGCSVNPAGDMGQPEAAGPTPGNESRPTPTPTPVETAQTEETELPETKSPQSPAPPDLESTKSRVLRWCEENRDRFSNAQWYAGDRALWFAPYTGGYTPPEGVYYYEDPTGVQAPEEAAAALTAQAVAAGENLTAVVPLDWSGMTDVISEQAGGAESEKELTRQLESLLSAYPALGEDMWLCGWADSTADAYVMMRQGNAYRLQRDGAFGTYAVSPRVRVLPAFAQAWEAYGWMAEGRLPCTADSAADEEGRLFYRVDRPGISSALELRAYLKTLFSDDIVDTLFAYGYCRDFDGVLYVLPAYAPEDSGGAPAGQPVEESDLRVIYRAEADYVYELVGDGWIFTEFPFSA